jgi:hypothetical protein
VWGLESDGNRPLQPRLRQDLKFAAHSIETVHRTDGIFKREYKKHKQKPERIIQVYLRSMLQILVIALQARYHEPHRSDGKSPTGKNNIINYIIKLGQIT